MTITRRGFVSALAALSSGATLPRHAATSTQAPAEADNLGSPTWEEVRAMFDLRPDRIHMSGLLFASHPRPVRNAIAKHREELQRDPASYISHERWRLEGEVLKAASSYLAVPNTEIALTDSTSMALGLLYSGLKLSQSDEVLTTTHDHYATEAALLVCRERTGCRIKRIDMYRDPATVSAEEMVDAVRRGITRPTIPTWEPGVFYSQIGWRERPAIGGGQLMSPAGYHAFDHTWAVGSAFDLHASLGKTRVAERIHQLNRELKEAMPAMRHVRLATPMSADLSAGIVCFDIEGMTADNVVAALNEKGVIASRTPYRRQYARLCPGLLTPGDDVARTAAALRALA